jgi:hypothetical protein
MLKPTSLARTAVNGADSIADKFSWILWRKMIVLA